MSADHYENFPAPPGCARRRCVRRSRRSTGSPAPPTTRRRGRCPRRTAPAGRLPRRLGSGGRPGGLVALGRTFHRLPAASDPPAWLPAAAARPADAFAQDVVKQRYQDRAELLDYCRRSANPVEPAAAAPVRRGDRSLRQSDAICTVLQLINFWQDLSVDTVRGRLSSPSPTVICHGHGLSPLVMPTRRPCALVVRGELTQARALMLEGAPLVHRAWWSGWSCASSSRPRIHRPYRGV